jgi:aryl-alcohol dehydrogenase-like predicted oxidoreductase
MRYVEVQSARLSVIGLGTWQFGSTEWGYGRTYAQGPARDITRRAIELGVNLIDTAEIYGFGRSEQILGEALEGVRDRAFIATKLFPAAPFAPVIGWRARDSARRLRTDTIDLYQLHWPNRLVPLAQQMQGLHALQERGLVRHVGVSNYSRGGWEAAERALGGPVLSNQVSYSLVQRAPEREIVPYAQKADRLVIAYSPLGQGFLSGRYDADHSPSGATRAANPLFQPDALEAGRELLGALDEVARRHDATSSQVALAWLIRRPNVVAIPGASSVAQLEANAAAADLSLSDEDDRLLTDASDRFRPQTNRFAQLGRRFSSYLRP